MSERYWLRIGEGKWREITRKEFAAAERRAGFHSKTSSELATGGFNTEFGHGRITYGEITVEDYGWDPDFLRDAGVAQGAGQG